MLRLQNDQASLTESLSYTIKLWFYNKNFLHFYIFYKSCKPPPSLCSSSSCPSSSFSLPPLSSSSDTNCLLSPVYLASPIISHLYYCQHLIKSDFIIIGVSFYSFQKLLPPLYWFVALGLLFHEHHRLPTPTSHIHLSACTISLLCYHRRLKSKFIITMITLQDLPAVAATHLVPYC